jgi:hypothetical protein
MKTAKQAIIEHVQAFPFYRTTKPEIARQSFKAGIDLAQRWISVEEELPPPVRQGGYSETVLIKDNFGGHKTGYYYHKDKCWIDGLPNGFFREITHWRYIELK